MSLAVPSSAPMRDTALLRDAAIQRDTALLRDTASHVLGPRALVTRLTRHLLGLRRWLPSLRVTPFAIAVMSLLVASSLALDWDDADAGFIARWASTNVHNLIHHPLASTVASAFVVQQGFLIELALVSVAFVTVERARGTGLAMSVAIVGHVLPTLLTEGAVALGIGVGFFPHSDAFRSDVGISYAMYAMTAAAVFLLRGRARLLAGLILLAVVVTPLLDGVDMTGLGHLLSVLTGVGVLAVHTRRRTFVAAVPAR